MAGESLLFQVDLGIALHQDHLPALEHLDLPSQSGQLLGELSATMIKVAFVFPLRLGDVRGQLRQERVHHPTEYIEHREANYPMHTSCCN